MRGVYSGGSWEVVRRCLSILFKFRSKLVNNRTSGGFVPISINYLLICFLPFFFFLVRWWPSLSHHLVPCIFGGWIVFSP